MGREIPFLTLEAFRGALLRCSSQELDEGIFPPLYQHYLELRRWNRRLSLVGPGTVDEVVSRHYAESLAALPLLEGARRLVDLGSGAGFPGFVLAAARPELDVTLIESRQRKWAFLRSAVRRGGSSDGLSGGSSGGGSSGGLSCRCLNARVRVPLPDGFPSEVDLVTSRALALDPEILAAIHRSSPGARFLFWQGAEPLRLPSVFRKVREIPLLGSEHRRIVEIHAT
jgi:16S rRNA G527 N7-methylase RsmG